MIDLTPILEHLPAWLLVLARLSGVFLLSPVLGSAMIPRQVKAFLVIGLSFCVYPVLMSPTLASSTMLGAYIGTEVSMWWLLPMMALELLLGYAIGYAAMLPLVGLQTGGAIIDQQMGLGLAGVYNPELGEQSTVTGEVLFMLGLVMFLIIGGHHALFAVMVSSFQHLPPGGLTGFTALVEMAVGLVTLMLDLSIKVAAPVLGLLFLESVAMGFIARTVPQMNILSVGFIVRIVLGLFITLGAIGTIGFLAQEHLVMSIDRVRQMIESTAATAN